MVRFSAGDLGKVVTAAGRFTKPEAGRTIPNADWRAWMIVLDRPGAVIGHPGPAAVERTLAREANGDAMRIDGADLSVRGQYVIAPVIPTEAEST
jgi:hypothetical protein